MVFFTYALTTYHIHYVQKTLKASINLNGDTEDSK